MIRAFILLESRNNKNENTIRHNKRHKRYS